MARKKRNPDAEKLAESILNTYQPESVVDMQDVLKDVFGPLFEKMLQGELNNHLTYDALSGSPKKHVLSFSFTSFSKSKVKGRFPASIR
ncbi:hypothetical protein EfmAA610_33510 (plasmid) [Enterococcus faecium]|nr:hypothetical protein EfmAA610_33510 [Enterococcus faecium]